MTIGLLYVVIIILACMLGAVSGMGGGILIKPIFDWLAIDSMLNISLYATVAVFVMAIVSVWRQLRLGVRLPVRQLAWIIIASMIGGVAGNLVFQSLLQQAGEQTTLLWQISLTLLTLAFTLLYTRNEWPTLRLTATKWHVISGLILGFLASFLGIGGGPINVAIFMWWFNWPIKNATVYSIVTIFFSQFAKLLTISQTDLTVYDWSKLPYIIVAAIIGGLLGAQLSRWLSEEKTRLVFQGVIILVMLLNAYNGWQILTIT
jgi:uncharacterized membrane protein YfcA